MAVAKTFLFVCVSLLAHIAGVFSQSQFLRWCVQENGMCHQNWECCDKMFCSDHFGIGKCIPLTSSIPIPAATWPQTYPCPWQWPPYWPLKPKKKKKKKKKKIIIRVCGDLMGLNVKAKKKNSLFRSLKCKQKQGRIGHN